VVLPDLATTPAYPWFARRSAGPLRGPPKRARRRFAL